MSLKTGMLFNKSRHKIILFFFKLVKLGTGRISIRVTRDPGSTPARGNQHKKKKKI